MTTPLTLIAKKGAHPTLLTHFTHILSEERQGQGWPSLPQPMQTNIHLRRRSVEYVSTMAVCR